MGLGTTTQEQTHGLEVWATLGGNPRVRRHKSRGNLGS